MRDHDGTFTRSFDAVFEAQGTRIRVPGDQLIDESLAIPRGGHLGALPQGCG
jgi:hypothetical protein